MKIKEKFGYLTMAMAVNIVFSFKNVYYLIFLTNILEIPVGVAGLITAIGTIWDAINDPLLGVLVANRNYKTGERVRPLLKKASIPWGITLLLLFCNFHLKPIGTIVLCFLLYFMFETAYTLITIPYTAMASLATENENERKTINALRGFGAGIGSGIGAVAITPLIRLFGGLAGGENAVIGIKDTKAIFLTALVMGCICIFGSLFHYFTSKERVHTAADNENIGSEKLSLLRSYRILFQLESWKRNMAYFLLYGFSNVLTMTMVAYYASYVLKSSSLAAPIMAAYMGMYLVGAAITPMLDARLGRKRSMVVSLLVQMIGKVPFFFAPDCLPCMLINAACCGLGGSTVFVLAGTNRTVIADIIEIKCNRRADSIVSSCENLFLKLTEAFGQWVITFSLALAGFNVSNFLHQTQASIYVIYATLGIVPFLISAIALLTIRKLDPNKEYRILKEVNIYEKTS